jgi:hypothetical protein
VNIPTFNQTITENLGFPGRRKSTGKGLIKALVRKLPWKVHLGWLTKMLALTKTFQLTRNARWEVQDGKCKTGSARREVARRKVRDERFAARSF